MADDHVCACEKTASVNEIDPRITTTVLLVLYNTIGNLIEYINNNTDGANLGAISAEDFFSKAKMKVRKKRGRKPSKPTEDQIEWNKTRSDLFVKFWNKYPRKDSEENARKWWLRIRDLERIFPSIMEALDWQIEQWEGGKYAPSPVKYILDKRWNDKPLPGFEKRKVVKSALGENFPAN